MVTVWLQSSHSKQQAVLSLQLLLGMHFYILSFLTLVLSLWFSFYLPLDYELHENRALCASLLLYPCS